MAAAEEEEKGSQWRVVVRTLDGDDGDQGDASSGGSRAKGRLSALSVASGSGGSIAVAVDDDENIMRDTKDGEARQMLRFEYDFVIGSETSPHAMLFNLCRPLIEFLFVGQSSNVLFCGGNSLESLEELLRRSSDYLFHLRQEAQSTAGQEVRYSQRVSIASIDGSHVHDGLHANNQDLRTVTTNNSVRIPDLTSVDVKSSGKAAFSLVSNALTGSSGKANHIVVKLILERKLGEASASSTLSVLTIVHVSRSDSAARGALLR